jgi:small subunit ribosomal protein S1
MNTDENTTTPPEATLPARPDTDQGAAAATRPAEGAPPASPSADETAAQAAPEHQGGDPPVPALAKAPAKASANEDWDEQPGDDIGNRLPGAKVPDDIGNRRAGGHGGGHAGGHADGKPKAAAGQPGGEEGGTGKKRRRRRRRKGGAQGAEGAATGAEGEANAAAPAEGEGEEGDDEAAEGEAAEGAEGAGPDAEGKRKKRGKGAPPGGAAARERPAFSIGEEVFGRVSKVTDSAVWIDIAGKATGLFDRREIMDEEAPVEGDQFIATVASTGVRGGMLMLSRLPLILEETRKTLEAAAQSGEAITGFITGAVKGGLEVDLGGLRAFAPASHVDLRHGADLNYLVGQRLDFIVTQYAKKGRDIVVSRRKMLEEENKKVRAEAVAKIEPGSVHKGIVRKVVAWGVFVALPDAGNVEGLVHMTEASHDRGAKLNDLFKPGAEIEVKVLRVDEKGKLWLSRKAVTADPWDVVKDKYAVGSRHKGKVARLQPFGAFIELEPGIDGLIHTADLSLKPIQHPQEVVKVGDEIEVVVASCDSGARKIGLHPAPPPGEEAEPRQRVQPHKTVKVAVAQVIEGGLIVRVLGVTGRSSRGFIPAGHTGTARGTDLRKEFPIGTQLEAKVIEIDPRRGEAKLSIRAVKEDAEKQAYQQYRAGVAREAKFGTFADLMKKSS